MLLYDCLMDCLIVSLMDCLIYYFYFRVVGWLFTTTSINFYMYYFYDGYSFFFMLNYMNLLTIYSHSAEL